LVEDVVIKEVSGFMKGMGIYRGGMERVGRVLGHFWVMAFWGWAVPGCLFPKMYHGLSEREKILMTGV